jgi:hypothetical protein
MSDRFRTITKQRNTLYWVDLVCGMVISYVIGIIIKKVHKR